MLFYSSAISGLDVFIPGIILLGLSIGFLSGLLGVGGGFLITPMLNILFGIPYNVAVGSGLVQMVGTAISGIIGHRKRGNVDIKLGLVLASGSLVGIFAGTRFINFLRDMQTITINSREIVAVNFYISILYAGLLLYVGGNMYREAFHSKDDRMNGNSSVAQRLVKALQVPPLFHMKHSTLDSISIWVLLFSGLCIGFLSGLMGVGGGFVVLPFMIYALGMPTSIAIGTSLLYVLLSAVMGSFAHLISRNVDWGIVIFILAGSISGAQLGALLSSRIRAVLLRRYFVVLVGIAFLLVVGNVLVSMGWIVF